MVEYCERDLQLTNKVLSYLEDKLSNFGDKSIILEHGVQTVVTKQIQNGWFLDQKKCFELLGQLKERKIIIEDNVHKIFKPLPVFVKHIKLKYKKDKSLSTIGLKFLGDRMRFVSGDFSRVDFPEFNLGSRKQIGIYLKFFGWKPKDFTDKGHPIVDEEILSKVENIPEAKLIAEYLLLQK